MIEKQHTEKDIGRHYKYSYKGIKMDPYRIFDIYKINDSAIEHAIKKLLRAGGSVKDFETDLREVIVTIERRLEMLEEDAKEEPWIGIDWGKELNKESDIENSPIAPHAGLNMAENLPPDNAEEKKNPKPDQSVPPDTCTLSGEYSALEHHMSMLILKDLYGGGDDKKKNEDKESDKELKDLMLKLRTGQI